MIERADKIPFQRLPLSAEMWIRCEFNLPENVISQLENFYLRIWQGSYVYDSVQDGILHGRFDDWIVHWQSTPEVVRQAEQVGCSFREYKGKKYVVVKVWDGKNRQERNDRNDRNERKE